MSPRTYVIAFQLQGEVHWHLTGGLNSTESKRILSIYAESPPVRRVYRARIEDFTEREPEGREPTPNRGDSI